jgi:ABC-2 type transport system permease protein
MYPISSFPGWLQAVAAVDPFAYGVHGLRAVLLKHAGLEAIAGDVAFLAGFSAVCITGTVLLFRRRL